MNAEADRVVAFLGYITNFKVWSGSGGRIYQTFYHGNTGEFHIFIGG